MYLFIYTKYQYYEFIILNFMLQKTPKSIWFIMCEELYERLNYHGLRSKKKMFTDKVLTLFLS